MTRACPLRATAVSAVSGALVTGALLAGSAAPAAAHAILVESAPPIGGAVAPGGVAIALRYNSRIDRARSRISLTRPDHSDVVLAIAPSSPEDQLDTTITLGAGAYVLHWQVLATDGHITRGDVPFKVNPGEAGKP